ncbi:putative sensor domain DACNV-containing protein [Sorangium sp. So ce388]|uniref:putative sensor domain DACNV-containing protein n=1 Tax=Sorangium sp. So ce388 TaxID=3133309 RepID=UPI003F5B2FFD
MSTPVTLPDDAAIIDHITICADKVFKYQRGRGANTAPPPTRRQVHQLLILAFAASIEHEEGRKVAFTLFFDHDSSLVDYEFEQPLALTPAALARLSVALDPSRTYICATGGPSGLEIVGLYHFGDHHSFRAPRSAPSHFSVRVVSPGVLVIRYDARLILTYRRGEVVCYPGDFEWMLDAERALSPPIDVEADEGRKFQLQQCFVHIAESMVRMRHGGALLILPNGLHWQERATSCRFAPRRPASRARDAEAFSVEHENRRQDAMARLLSESPCDHIDRNAGAAIISALHYSSTSHLGVELEWIAHFTGTDGMTVVRPDLTLLCFGAFFRTETPPGGLRVRIVDPYQGAPNEVREGELAAVGGARHQSAAVTCHGFPGSKVIVASQDGALSTMQWNEESQAVLVYRHLELMLNL